MGLLGSAWVGKALWGLSRVLGSPSSAWGTQRSPLPSVLHIPSKQMGTLPVRVCR